MISSECYSRRGEKRALISGTLIIHLYSFVGSELTPECSFQKYSSGVVGEHVTGKRASRCTWTRAHPPISAADAPRALNPLSFRGGGEASARLSHRRVSSGCVRTKLHRRSSRRRAASLSSPQAEPTGCVRARKSADRTERSHLDVMAHLILRGRDCVPIDSGRDAKVTIDRCGYLEESRVRAATRQV